MLLILAAYGFFPFPLFLLFPLWPCLWYTNSLTARGISPRMETKSMSDELNKALTPDAAAMKDKDADVSSKARPRRKRKVSYLTVNKIEVIDYKDVPLLRKFINDRGKMIPSRQSGTTARQQRQVAQAIKRAREMALIPFVVTEMSTEKREPREPREPREGRDGRDNRETREPRKTEAPLSTEE